MEILTGNSLTLKPNTQRAITAYVGEFHKTATSVSVDRDSENNFVVFVNAVAVAQLDEVTKWYKQSQTTTTGPIVNSDQEYKDLLVEHQELLQSHEKLTKQHHSTEGQLTQMQQRLSTLMTDKDAIQHDRDSLQGQNNTLTTDVNDLTIQRNALQAENKKVVLVCLVLVVCLIVSGLFNWFMYQKTCDLSNQLHQNQVQQADINRLITTAGSAGLSSQNHSLDGWFLKEDVFVLSKNPEFTYFYHGVTYHVKDYGNQMVAFFVPKGSVVELSNTMFPTIKVQVTPSSIHVQNAICGLMNSKFVAQMHVVIINLPFKLSDCSAISQQAAA